MGVLKQGEILGVVHHVKDHHYLQEAALFVLSGQEMYANSQLHLQLINR